MRRLILGNTHTFDLVLGMFLFPQSDSTGYEALLAVVHPDQYKRFHVVSVDDVNQDLQPAAATSDQCGVIESAFRLQPAILDAISIDDEPESIQWSYGLDSKNEFQSC